MWSIGPGSDVTKRIAAPMVGGIFTSFLLELLAYPAIYELWKRNSIDRQFEYVEDSLQIGDERLALSAKGD
jgi:Cu(I)/Ag(I) efflux system membrane protein CusA/SilA